MPIWYRAINFFQFYNNLFRVASMVRSEMYFCQFGTSLSCFIRLFFRFSCNFRFGTHYPDGGACLQSCSRPRSCSWSPVPPPVLAPAPVPPPVQYTKFSTCTCLCTPIPVHPQLYSIKSINRRCAGLCSSNRYQ